MNDLIYAFDQVKVESINGFVGIVLGFATIASLTFLAFVYIIRGRNDKKD